LKPAEETLRPLLLLGLEGDRAAYASFLTQAAAHLRGYLRRRLARWPDDVEDVMQEALLAVHNQRHTWRRTEPLMPWLHAIVRYKLVDALRARSTREAVILPFDEDADEALAAADPHPGEACRDVRVLLATLPDRFRLPIECVKLQGLSVAETAQRTGMSASAVKVGVHRGLRLLARRLREGRRDAAQRDEDSAMKTAP
jgi:RNA polymerase sigma-70 factor (ECF subfamily)